MNSHLSVLAKYDDLMRCKKELSNGIAEEEFYRYLQYQEEMKSDNQKLIEEARNLQIDLDNQTQQTIAFESKLAFARKMLESERKLRKEAQIERDQLEQKIFTLRDLLMNENTIKEETKKHLAVLSGYTKKRKSQHYMREGDDYNDINSTGSFLSDLSLTQSGDDFLDSKLSGNSKWKKHRPSCENRNVFLNLSGKKSIGEKRKSVRHSLLEYEPGEKIIAKTRVSIPNDKKVPIFAESTIESVPHEAIKASSSTGSSTDQNPVPLKYDMKTPSKRNAIYEMTPKKFTPSAPSIEEFYNAQDGDIYATVKKKNPSKIHGRPHNFVSKIFLKPESCSYCQKKIGFVGGAIRCSECRTTVHQECRDKLNFPCLPQSANANSMKGGAIGVISDYAPSVPPYIPALIVHCVNEIESRGLNEVGLYRISGGELDIKNLKERFLRNKGIPSLNNVDIHVICGCVRNFLRSLREPLIPSRLWTTFSNAAQSYPNDENDVNNEIRKAVSQLPLPNRDTLAFLIQHFQRIAECPAVKMPLTNFAKVFGPTIVGYSSTDADQYKILSETQVQYSVMCSLLDIPTEYWNKFIVLDTRGKVTEQEYGSKYYSYAPQTYSTREKKFYNTPPSTLRQKKK